jgi:uncharacterized membrane protein YphA (DoxX/SURF4 family)
MKKILLVVRIFVGVLFIFSGLIKANDPHGLGYKMQEFFEVWNEGLAGSSFFLKGFLTSLFDFFHEHALLLAVVMIALEIIAGVAVIIGWQMRFFSWLLLLMIVFFTFLTGYAWLATKPDGSPKFTNCGCFGDCLPITPDISFTKDVILTVLILLLFFFRKKITSAFSKRAALIAMLTVTVLSFGVQWYTLSYLPVLDCLPFKKGNNITEQMKMPANAIPDSTVITYIYEKGGEQVEFTTINFPKDFSPDTYKFIKRYDKLIRKGKNNVPPIKGFTLIGTDDTDSAQYVLSKPYAILLFAEDFSTPVKEWSKKFSSIYKMAKQKNISVYLVTTKYDDALAALAGTDFSGIQKFKCDVTNVRTAARSNPCLFILQKGTIEGKWSARQFGKAEAVLEKIPVQQQEQEIKILEIAPGSLDAINNADSNLNKADTIIKN